MVSIKSVTNTDTRELEETTKHFYSKHSIIAFFVSFAQCCYLTFSTVSVLVQFDCSVIFFFARPP